MLKTEVEKLDIMVKLVQENNVGVILSKLKEQVRFLLCIGGGAMIMLILTGMLRSLTHRLCRDSKSTKAIRCS